MRDRHLERLGQKIEEKIRLIGKLSTNVMLISYYDNIGLTKEEAELIEVNDDYIYMYHEFQCNKMSKAYEPFLEWIKDAYQEYVKITIDEFMETCNIYIPHRTIIKSYFETGIGKRNEFLFLKDIEFEKQKMYEGIISMISYISKLKPVVFIFNKLQFSGSSTMELLNYFFGAVETEQIAIFATFNNESAVLRKKQEVWNKLVDNFNENNSIYDWDKFHDEMIIAEMESEDISCELSDAFIKDKISNIWNMCEFLALSQAHYNLQNLYHKFEVEKFDISPDLKFKIYKIYIKTCIELNHIAEAFDAKSNLKLLINNSEKRFEYYIMQAFLEIANEQYTDARKTITMARELAHGDLRKKDIIEVFDYIAKVEYWNNDWKGSNNLEDENIEIIDICKRLNYKSMLARIYISGFENDPKLYTKVEGLEERLVHHNKGMKIAEELGNVKLQLEGCYHSIIIASRYGYTDVVNYIYKEKCIPLARKSQNIKEEAIAYNGLGYNYSDREEFDIANEYFNKALIIYYQFNNIEYILETLYNMTLNAIMVEDYKSADSYVSTCLYAIENMRKDGKIGIFHVSKLYGYKALCCYYLGNQYMSKIYMGYVKRMLDYILDSDENIDDFELWYDELFIYYYVEGLIYKSGELYEKAKDSLEQALFYSEKSGNGKIFTYSRCQIELARIYMILEKKRNAVESLKKALEYTKERKLEKQRLKLLLFLREITGEDWITEEDEDQFAETKLIWEKGSLELNLSGITIADVKERIKNIGIVNRAQEEKERMEFLSRWSKIINKTVYSIEDMVNNAMRIFSNNFQIENIVFINIKDKHPFVLYEKMNNSIDDKILASIYEYAKNNPNEFATSRMDKFFYDYKELMSLFNVSQISSFMYIPIVEKEEVKYIMIMYMNMQNTWGSNLNAFMLNREIQSLISSSIRQFTDAIEREQIHAELRSMNNKLRYVALVDNLTGLFNRQGLQYNLDKKLHEGNRITAILYVDLDNFKYYNDQFGHEVGDLILVSFANIMKNICEGDGFAVRYGGDEFLMILNLDRQEEAIEAASSIYDVLEKEDSFVHLVERSIGRKVQISENKKVSCSIGISFLDKYEGNKAFDLALKQADDALFYVKRTGKRRYEMWKPEMI